jgi:hypothetical protein
MRFSRGIIPWNMSFARAAQNSEANAFTSFYRLLCFVRMRREGKDRLSWVPSKRGLFGFKSFYTVMGYLNGFCFLERVFGGLKFY